MAYARDMVHTLDGAIVSLHHIESFNFKPGDPEERMVEKLKGFETVELITTGGLRYRILADTIANSIYDRWIWILQRKNV